MNTTPSPDTVDTRIVFKVYAGVAWAVGLLILPTLFAMRPPDSTAALAGFFLASLVAAGCSAAGFATIEDPEARHRALFWFMLGHAGFFAIAFAMTMGHRLNQGVDLFPPVVAIVAFVLFYFWQTGDGHRAGESQGFTELFGRSRQSTELLRSAYEERIREAASQEERHRLARDLHDSIKQQIFAMQTAAATAQARFDGDPAGAKEALDRLRESGREATAEMEALLDSLRASPLENAGLVESLKKQCEALQFRTGAQVDFVLGTLPASELLAPAAQHAIFRIAQEALANVGRHARASHVRVELASGDDSVELRVEDDGAGFDQATSARGMGLTNMRARAAAFDGRLNVRSQPGHGTVVTVTLPHRPAEGADISDYRRRVRLWAAILAFIGVDLVANLAWRQSLNDVFFVGMLFVGNLVIFARVVVTYRRAKRLSQEASCIASPSHL